MATHQAEKERLAERPAAQCARPMRADRWCRRALGHSGAHKPSTRSAPDLRGGDA